MAEIALAGATAILRQTVGVLSNLVVQEGSRLSRVRESIVWIESEMRHMQSYLEDAEAKQGGSRGVANLVIDIRDLAHDVEDIMQKYFPRIATHKREGFLGWLKSPTSILSYGYAARDFVVEIEEIKRRVENINRVRQTYGIDESSCRPGKDMWDERRSFPHVDEPNVVGFEKLIKKLVAKMGNEELQLQVISIIGMAGLGKTTLAKKVYNSVQHGFECSAWIYVSQEPNIKELFREIATQVGLRKEKWEENFEANLFTLLSQHRYVIVIDDMWHTETWDAMKNVIPTNTENGSRIILTSRNRDVGTHVGGSSSLHLLQPLNKENSRKLFFKMVMPPQQNINETSDRPQLESIGEQILERCGGVPLAIVLIASLLLLRERSENLWKGVLKSMGQDEDQCSEIFALSYKDLPTNLKPCFLYFGFYPEGYNISTFLLINIWAAEGFIQGSRVREVEDVGHDYLNQLIARNLIQVGRRSFNGTVISCHIHDILHSLCIRVAKEINFFSTHNDLAIYNPVSRVRRVTTHRSDFSDYIRLNNRTPKLRSMMCFSGDMQKLGRKRVKKFLRDCRFLRVFNVRCDYLPRCFPNEVGNLRHLSYLGLRNEGKYVIELPYTISSLKNLMTLDVGQCYYGVILPNVIWSMKQLRHIILPFNCKAAPTFRDMFHPIEISLPNLQTLYWLPGVHFQANWLHKLTNLRTLGVHNWTERIIMALSDVTPVSHRLEVLWLSLVKMSTTLNLSRYENLRILYLLDVWMIELPRHDKLPPNLTKLFLRNTHLKIDPMESLKKLPQLKMLSFAQNSYDGDEMVCSGEPGNFPQLELLEIIRLEKPVLTIEEGGMPRLKDFDIYQCNPRRRVPQRIRNIMKKNEGEYRLKWY